MSVETEIESAAAQMESWAKDDSHGYDQAKRWGPNYDCSSAVIQAWEKAGVPVKTSGATYTGNMYSVFLTCGFEDVTASIDLSCGTGLKRGDVLLNHKNHTAMYIGGGKTAEASINEHGATTGGTTGDQTGREFLLRAYRDYPWDCVLRYSGGRAESTQNAKTGGVELPYLHWGDVSEAVRAMQLLLMGRGFFIGSAGADGEYGGGTRTGLTGFQRSRGLEADGVCGPRSWERLLKG